MMKYYGEQNETKALFFSLYFDTTKITNADYWILSALCHQLDRLKNWANTVFFFLKQRRNDTKQITARRTNELKGAETILYSGYTDISRVSQFILKLEQFNWKEKNKQKSNDDKNNKY